MVIQIGVIKRVTFDQTQDGVGGAVGAEPNEADLAFAAELLQHLDEFVIMEQQIVISRRIEAVEGVQIHVIHLQILQLAQYLPTQLILCHAITHGTLGLQNQILAFHLPALQQHRSGSRNSRTFVPF